MRNSLVACLLAMIAVVNANAATRTWQGDVNTNWNTAANWAENAVPADGDDLVFPDNPTSRNSNNDIAGLSINSISITTTNVGLDYNFTGLGITLDGPMSFNNPNSGSAGAPNWNIPLTLGASLTITSSGRLSHIDNTVDLGVNTLTVQVDGDLWIDGIVSGAGGIVKNGGSAFTLGGNNTYAGATQVNAGALQVRSANALGGSVSGTTFAGGTTLIMGDGPFTLAEPLTFSGPTGTIQFSGNTALGGTLAFTGTLTFNMLQPGSVAGAITSAGTLVIIGAQSLSTSIDHPAFTGLVSIQGGQFIPQSTFPAAITLQSGGLFGTATSGLLTITGGTFAPGLVTQFFAPTGLASSGGMHNLLMVLGAPVVNYDQLQVTGTVSLAGTTLNSTAAGTLPLGQVFVIILNDGADPVVGTYAGKPEGAVYFQASNWWQITYVGGDGNDVVLTTVAAPAPTAGTSVPVPGPGPLALALLAAAIVVASRRRVR